MSGVKRSISDKCLKLLESFPVLAIIGPRQCGKTTLSKMLRPNWKYVDLEDPSIFEQITQDTKFFFSKFPSDMIIDEAQISPEIFNTLRGVIDSDRKKNNRFIITGSSSPELLKNISESLAGRVATVELGTLKFNEFKQKPLSPFFSLFEGADPDSLLKPNINISNKDIQQFWFQGSYPDVALAKSDDIRGVWYDNYIRNYIHRDVKRLFPGLQTQKFQRFTIIQRPKNIVLNLLEKLFLNITKFLWPILDQRPGLKK